MGRILLSCRWLRGVSGVAVLAMAVAAPAQTPVAAGSGTGQTEQSVEDVLHGMSDQADVIFVGQVVAIRPHDGDGMGAGFVEVDFQIDHAVRGCAGGSYAMREWAGLWAGDANRYRVGQRLLMLLHAPGASGLSSPVGGLDGAIPIRGVADASSLTGTVTDLPAPIADLRWLGAKVVHPMTYVLQAPLTAAPLTVGQPTADSSKLIVNPVAAAEDDSSRASTAVQQAPVDTVVRMLASWKRATDDGH